MPELTKTKEPDEKRKKEMFKLYKNICTRSFSYNKKKMLISTILGYEDWAWRVVGISKEALIRCKRNDYNRPKGLVRDHINERKETYKRLIEEQPSEEIWWKYFWKRDKTRLLTSEEHININIFNPENLIKINWTEGYFQSRGYAGFNFRKSIEGEFVKQLCKQHKI